MTPEEPTLDEAAVSQAAESEENESPEAGSAETDSEQEGEAHGDEAEESAEVTPDGAEAEPAAEADADATPDDPAEAYRQALDRYLAGDLQRALAIVDSVLARDEESELKPRLERLRRRAEDRLAKEGPPAEESAEESTDAESGSGEVAAVAEAPPAEAKEAPAATEEGAEESTDPEASSADESGSGEVAVAKDGNTPSSTRIPKQKAKAPGTGSGKRVKKVARPPERRTRPAPAPAAKVRPKPAASKEAISAAINLQTNVEKLQGDMERLAKSTRGIEAHVLKVAEAYQRIARAHKRKEQAYDQLYDELRQYKEDFLLKAQKPLYMDIILLHDGIARTLRTVEEDENEKIDKAKVAESIKHVLEEVLEVLYRRDIEVIEERPKTLDIEFQKPIRRIETDDPGEDRAVDQIVREGFRLNGAILRPQEVIVKRCLKERETK